MSGRSHQQAPWLCQASRSCEVTPFVNGKPRVDLAYRRRVYCDRPAGHEHRHYSKTHYDATYGMLWEEEEGEL